MKPGSYHRNPRAEIIDFVPVDARDVLELGCGEGHFGELLKTQRGACVWGVELEAAAAAAAESRLDRVLQGDIHASLVDLPTGRFDVVVANDILEHLVDPEAVLRALRRVLRPGGVIVSSIPNIRYLPTFRRLVLNGEWEYEDAGILDRTHLRFYTEKSILRMYDRVGYDVLRHEGINGELRPSWKLRALFAVARHRLDDTSHMQFATVARVRAEPAT